MQNNGHSFRGTSGSQVCAARGRASVATSASSSPYQLAWPPWFWFGWCGEMAPPARRARPPAAAPAPPPAAPARATLRRIGRATQAQLQSQREALKDAAAEAAQWCRGAVSNRERAPYNRNIGAGPSNHLLDWPLHAFYRVSPSFTSGGSRFATIPPHVSLHQFSTMPSPIPSLLDLPVNMPRNQPPRGFPRGEHYGYRSYPGRDYNGFHRDDYHSDFNRQNGYRPENGFRRENGYQDYAKEYPDNYRMEDGGRTETPWRPARAPRPGLIGDAPRDYRGNPNRSNLIECNRQRPDTNRGGGMNRAPLLPSPAAPVGRSRYDHDRSSLLPIPRRTNPYEAYPRPLATSTPRNAPLHGGSSGFSVPAPLDLSAAIRQNAVARLRETSNEPPPKKTRWDPSSRRSQKEEKRKSISPARKSIVPGSRSASNMVSPTPPAGPRSTAATPGSAPEPIPTAAETPAARPSSTPAARPLSTPQPYFAAAARPSSTPAARTSFRTSEPAPIAVSTPASRPSSTPAALTSTPEPAPIAAPTSAARPSSTCRKSHGVLEPASTAAARPSSTTAGGRYSTSEPTPTSAATPEARPGSTVAVGRHHSTPEPATTPAATPPARPCSAPVPTSAVATKRPNTALEPASTATVTPARQCSTDAPDLGRTSVVAASEGSEATSSSVMVKIRNNPAITSALQNIKNAYGASSPQEEEHVLSPSQDNTSPFSRKRPVNVTRNCGETNEAVASCSKIHSSAVCSGPSLSSQDCDLVTINSKLQDVEKSTSSLFSPNSASKKLSAVTEARIATPVHCSNSSKSSSRKSSSRSNEASETGNSSQLLKAKSSVHGTCTGATNTIKSNDLVRSKDKDSNSRKEKGESSSRSNVSNTLSKTVTEKSVSSEESKSRREKHRKYKSLEESGLLNPKFDKNFKIPKKAPLPNPLKDPPSVPKSSLKAAQANTTQTWLQQLKPKHKPISKPCEKQIDKIKIVRDGDNTKWKLDKSANSTDKRKSHNEKDAGKKKRQPEKEHQTDTNNVLGVLDGSVHFIMEEEVAHARAKESKKGEEERTRIYEDKNKRAEKRERRSREEKSRDHSKSKSSRKSRKRHRSKSRDKKKKSEDDTDWVPSRSRGSPVTRDSSCSPVGVASRTRSRTRSRSPPSAGISAGFSGRISDSESEGDLTQNFLYSGPLEPIQVSPSCSSTVRDSLSTCLKETQLKRALVATKDNYVDAWEHVNRQCPDELVDRDACTPPLPVEPRTSEEQLSPPQLSPAIVNRRIPSQIEQDDLAAPQLSPEHSTRREPERNTIVEQTPVNRDSDSDEPVIVDEFLSQSCEDSVEIICLETDEERTYMQLWNNLEARVRLQLDTIFDKLKLAFKCILKYIEDFNFTEKLCTQKSRVEEHENIRDNFKKRFPLYFSEIDESLSLLVEESLSKKKLLLILQKKWDDSEEDAKDISVELQDMRYLLDIVNEVPEVSPRDEKLSKTNSIVAAGLFKMPKSKKNYLKASSQKRQPPSRQSQSAVPSSREGNVKLEPLPPLARPVKQEVITVTEPENEVAVRSRRTPSRDSGYTSSPPR